MVAFPDAAWGLVASPVVLFYRCRNGAIRRAHNRSPAICPSGIRNQERYQCRPQRHSHSAYSVRSALGGLQTCRSAIGVIPGAVCRRRRRCTQWILRPWWSVRGRQMIARDGLDLGVPEGVSTDRCQQQYDPRRSGTQVRFEEYSFGSIRIDGVTYGHDLIIDRGQIRKRKKAASMRFRDAYGHTRSRSWRTFLGAVAGW